jgi:tRNA (guanine-N7-)-methyltransferase
MSEHLLLDPRHTGFDRLDLHALFGNGNPIVLEIGSGTGRFLLTSAAARPDQNFLGVEKSLHFHRVVAERLTRRNLTNIRLINHDAFVVMRKMLPDRSIAELHIYFPDPWPRPREQKRRIIRAEVLEEMRRVLTDDGVGVFVTDHQKYFEKAAPLIGEFFRAERRIPSPDDPPRTNYEVKYREEGRPVYEVRFRK